MHNASLNEISALANTEAGASWRQDRVAAWLFVPYAAWVAFASALNAAILALN